MALNNYANLQAAIADRVDRDDLTNQIIDAITLVEAQCNDTLFHPEREGVSTASTVAGTETLALPTDLYQLRKLTISSVTPKVILEQMTIGDLRDSYPDGLTGQPRYFAMQKGSEFVFGPVPDAVYTLTLNYYKTIPALSGANTTNWLLTAHPGVYLYGALVHCVTDDDPRKPEWLRSFTMAFDQCLSAGRKKAWAGAKLRTDVPPTYSTFNIRTG